VYIGSHLALLESKIIIINTFLKFDLKLESNSKLSMRNRAMYTPIDPVKINIVNKYYWFLKEIIKNILYTLLYIFLFLTKLLLTLYFKYDLIKTCLLTL